MVFDPKAFMQTAVESELSTSPVRVEDGDYRGFFDQLPDEGPKVIKRQDEEDLYILDIRANINDEEALSQLEDQDTYYSRMSLFLDIDKSGGLDVREGKNHQLGRVREALGQNKPGAWNFSMMLHVPCLMHLETDKNGYQKVTRVAPLED